MLVRVALTTSCMNVFVTDEALLANATTWFVTKPKQGAPVTPKQLTNGMQSRSITHP
jgi:hypothetical protein